MPSKVFSEFIPCTRTKCILFTMVFSHKNHNEFKFFKQFVYISNEILTVDNAKFIYFRRSLISQKLTLKKKDLSKNVILCSFIYIYI